MSMTHDDKDSFERDVHLSQHIDLSQIVSDEWMAGRHIVITGGAGAFGTNFSRRWAKAGASIVIADHDVEAGTKLAIQLREELKRDNAAYFVECDITKWRSQVELFKKAVELSPHGGIDTIVANAGAGGPDALGITVNKAPDPEVEPDFSITNTNYIGLLYTVYLAMYHLPRNPGSKNCSPLSDGNTLRDRHLLLMGSLASLTPVVARPQYTGSKHAVLGVFRSLRATSFLSGIRVTLLCPYFVESAMVAPHIKPLLEGTKMTAMQDVVDATTRLVADARISGRALVVSPPLSSETEHGGLVVPNFAHDDKKSSDYVSIWDCYAEDFQKVQAFTRRFIEALRQQELAAGIT